MDDPINQDLVACEGFVFCQDQDDVAQEPFTVVTLTAKHLVSLHASYKSSDDGTLVLDGTRSHHRELDFKRQIASLQRTVRRQRRVIRDFQACARDSKRARIVADKRPHAGMLIAVARNRGIMSGESAASFSTLIGGKGGISRSSVTRWEHAAGTSLLASASVFHKKHEARVMQQQSSFAMMTHRLRSDAGNSKTARQYKLQPMELLSSYLFDDGDTDSHLVYPDVQVVCDASANGCIHLTHRQLRLAGCSAFDVDQATLLGNTVAIHVLFFVHSFLSKQNNTIQTTGSSQFRHIALCGDCGADQVGMRTKIAQRYAGHTNVFVTGSACFMHQGNLASCQVVGAADAISKFWCMEWTYYSVLVKCTNLVRSKPIDFYKVACDIAGAESGDDSLNDARHARRKVCSCTTGRWGAVSSCEEYYLGFSSYAFVQQVLTKAFSKR